MKKKLAWFVVVFVTTCLAVLGGLLPDRRGNQRLSATISKDPLPSLETQVPLSKDQQLLVDALGPPQQFLVTQDEAKNARLEIWSYFNAQQGETLLKEAFDPQIFMFQDGKLLSSRPAARVTITRSCNVLPWQIPSGITEAGLRARWGEPDVVNESNSPLFGSVKALNYRNQFVLAFRNGKFWGGQSLLEGTVKP